MPQLLWDQVTQRRFEGGVDRGVLYLPDGGGVVWNGLTSVVEDDGGSDVTSYYFDGIKYLDSRAPGEFSASIKAITYPDEFEQFDGLVEINQGFFADDQMVTDTFGLSYRTGVGDDVSGLDLGYKVHILYNLTAKPDSVTFNTLNKSPEPVEFGWTVTGVPIKVDGCRPTVHFILDSTKLPEGAMAAIEDQLYGSTYSLPTLPTPTDLAGVSDYGISAIIREPI